MKTTEKTPSYSPPAKSFTIDPKPSALTEAADLIATVHGKLQHIPEGSLSVDCKSLERACELLKQYATPEKKPE